MKKSSQQSLRYGVYLITEHGEISTPMIITGLISLLASSQSSLGIFFPIRDSDLIDQFDVVLNTYETDNQYSIEHAYGVTQQQFDNDIDKATKEIIAQYQDLAQRCEVVLVIGNTYSDSNIATNSSLAANLATPVILVIQGNHRDVQEITAHAHHLCQRVSAAHACPISIIATRCDPQICDTVTQALTTETITAYALPEQSQLLTTESRLITQMRVDSTEKITLAQSLIDQHLHPDRLIEQLSRTTITTLTPNLFEYRLFEQAKSDPRHIVLPETTDDRILKAAAWLLAHQLVEITLIGNPDTITQQSKTLDIDLSTARIIDHLSSELTEAFIDDYVRLRAHKGMTIPQAQQRFYNPTYFATMMVRQGLADGMVAGSVQTTAQTLRPAFEIIGCSPGVSTVSSVFLMCLADRVVVFGDCAVIPSPTPKQLAEIAISSAHTASAFGVDPRVALLSYSTGDSASGPEIEKIQQAVQLIHHKQPQLCADGPIQYDAAVSPEVARKKLPHSPVAGKATVFIFPDLNAGNITYKAVQRNTGATAIGPILQGLAKPVNDLSRGALIDDIITTVVITAIQAQRISA